MDRKLIQVYVGINVHDPCPVILEVPADWNYDTLYDNWLAADRPLRNFPEFLKTCGARDPVSIKLEKWIS